MSDTGMPEALAVFLLFLGTLGWATLPLIPGIIELFAPRDAAPLHAVGSDSGDLNFFAESFTKRALREGLFGDTVPTRLSDGSRIRTHSADNPLPRQRTFTDFVVLTDSTPIPEGTEFASECLARTALQAPVGVTFRSLLGERDVHLGEDTTVLRWVHTRGQFEAETGTRLLGRATAEHGMFLAPGVYFDRLEAGVIVVSKSAPTEVQELPPSAYERFKPRDAQAMGPNYFRIEDDLIVPAGRVLNASVIVTGNLIVEDGARINGSVKAHEEIVVRGGGVIDGAATARGRVLVESGARVSGPIISESAVLVQSAVVGRPGTKITVSAPVVRLKPGATIYGTIMAAENGRTIP